jgi:pilus assembly protein CpaB
MPPMEGLEAASTVNKKTLVPLIGVAFVVAVISTWVFYGLVAGRLAQPASASARTVVIAARVIARGATVGTDDLKTRAWNIETLPDGTFSNPAQVVGTVASDTIAADEPVTASRVVGNGAGGAGVAIPSGLRAVSIQPDDSAGVLSLVKAGSRVDVQWVRARGVGSSEVDVKTLFERIAVFHVLRDGEGGKAVPSVVTLLLTNAEAEKLAAADSTGKIRLTLRNPVEGEVAPAARKEPVSQAAPAAPSAVPGKEFQLELSVARGDGQPAAESPKLVRLPSGAFEKYEIVGVSRGAAAAGQAVQLTSQGLGHSVRLRARLVTQVGGKIRLWLEPEMSWRQGEGTVSRRVQGEIEVGAGEVVLASGLAKSPDSGLVVLVRANPLK